MCPLIGELMIWFAAGTAGGPISQLVGFHVNPLYTMLAAVAVGTALLLRLKSRGLLPLRS